MPSPFLSDQTSDTYADVPILIHVGPHKTGTTWLQKNLLAQADGVVYAPNISLSHRAFLRPRFEDFSPAAARGILSEELARARAENKPLVISDEGLGGRPFGQRYVREVAAERLARTFPHAHILITTRQQDSVLLSMYSEYLRYGYSSSLPAFLSQETGHPNLHPLLDIAYYEWDRVLAVYRLFFPSEQVHALPMEWGLKAAENYPSALEAILGAPLNISASLNVEAVARRSLSGWALSVLRHSNKFYPQDSRYLSRGGRLTPNSLGYQVDRITPGFARTKSKLWMRNVVRDFVGDRFAASNRNFQYEIPYDLSELGYRVTPKA